MSKRDLINELLLCVFDALSQFRTLLAGGEPPYGFGGIFEKMVRRRLKVLIDEANKEKNLCDPREIPDYADAQVSYIDRSAPDESDEIVTPYAVVKRIRERATARQRAVLDAIVAVIADEKEIPGLAIGTREVKDLVRPRHIKRYLPSMTPKSISKMLRSLQNVAAKELRRSGLENMIPKGWTHKKTR